MPKYRDSHGRYVKPYAPVPNSPIGFAGKPVKAEDKPATEPRRVPIGFAPGQTTTQIEIG